MFFGLAQCDKLHGFGGMFCSRTVGVFTKQYSSGNCKSDFLTQNSSFSFQRKLTKRVHDCLEIQHLLKEWSARKIGL